MNRGLKFNTYLDRNTDPKLISVNPNKPNSDSTNPHWVLPPYDFDHPERWPALDPCRGWAAVEALAGVTDSQLRKRGVPRPEVRV